VEEVLHALGTRAVSGLSKEEAARRLVERGPNELEDRGTRSPWVILWEQFTSTMIVILVVAALASAFLRDYEDSVVIAVIVVLNAALGFAQEYRAERAMAALKRLSAPVVKVRREGHVLEIPAGELVPGDVVLLEAGNLVPADGRLLEGVNLRVQESALTGESEPVDKDPAALEEEDTPLGGRTAMVYSGTVVASGRGLFVVTETAMATELGKIAAMIQASGTEQTPLQRRLDQVGKVLALAALAIVGVVFVLGLLRGEDLEVMFLTAVSLAVAAVPEGLPAVVTIALALGAQRMLRRHALIRKLPAVETLGSVTMICSDKTGTLTENRMTATVLDVAGRSVDLAAGDGDTPGTASAVGPPGPSDRAVTLLLAGGALCNDALLEDGDGDALERDLTFLGMVGMIDPARPEAREAVATCKRAGIRPVMITGDHPLTAGHIAAGLGISDGGAGRTLTGRDIAGLSEVELEGLVEEVPVFARVSPEHKLRIVGALQRRGHIVAMTGDGVNDAPALRRADIGVAMGITGTDVSKEAADMVLTDDNFATIVAAVEQGRVIYDNIRKFIRYLLASNSAEILVMLAGPFFGLGLPLLPLQILWINLVTDGPPALALSAEPAEQGIMRRQPHPPGEGVFGRGLGRHVVWVGILMALVSLLTGLWYSQSSPAIWQTMVFTTLTLSPLGHVMAIRSGDESLFSVGPLSNKPLLLAVALTFALQLLAIYVPFFQEFLKTEALPPADLAIAVALGSVVFWAVEVEKWLSRQVGFREGSSAEGRRVEGS
jgi:Ca2+-transporting ATPase